MKTKLLIILFILSINALGAAKGGFENDIIYYAFIDRFMDGDTGNNIPKYAFSNEPSYLKKVIDNKIKNTKSYFEKYNPHLEGPGEIDIKKLVNETVIYNKINQSFLGAEYDPSKRYLGQYWGGDIQGIIQKLPYLSDLGITKLLLTPIMDNANGWIFHPNSNYTVRLKPTEDEKTIDHKKSHQFTSFHGYWTIDWFEIDEHLRSSKDNYENRFNIFKRLLQEAKKYNIGIILDITLNQTSPLPYDLKKDKLFRGTGKDQNIDTFVDEGAIYKHGIRLARGVQKNIKKYDPDSWFNAPMDVDFATNPSKLYEEVGRMGGGTPDLNQNYEHVEKYLLDVVEFWMRFNTTNKLNEENIPIHGFRLDAIKHVNNKFWKALEVRVENVWDDLKTKIPGLPEKAVLFGEYFDGGLMEKDSLDYISEMDHSSMFDFGLSIPLRQFFAGERNWHGTTKTLEEQTMGINHPDVIKRLKKSIIGKMIDSILFKNPLEIPNSHLIYENIDYEDQKCWVTFLESHDMPRMKTAFPHKNNGRPMSDESYASAVRFLFAARGVPLVMYGMETALALPYHPKLNGLFGIGGDPFNRPMMIWPGDPGWNQEIYDVTKEMIGLRKKYPILRYGETRFVKPDEYNQGDDLFMLRHGEEYDYSILYAYSTGGGTYTIDLQKNDIESNGEFEFSRNIKSDLKINKSVLTIADFESLEGDVSIKLHKNQAIIIVIKK